MHESQQLLQRYAREGDEDAFRKLVSAYIGLVQGVALRRVGGDTARALDIAQIVFTDLARQARRLRPETLLGGWLYQHTLFVASKIMRAERRRIAREKEAMSMSAQASEPSWAQLAPILDEAILELDELYRAAIILRFFENSDLKSVGRALNISDDAAQKRVQRALEKLRGIFATKGVTVSVGGLTTLLLANIPSAAAGAAGVVAAAALTSAATTSIGGIFSGLLMSKGKALVAIALLAGIGMALVEINKSPRPAASEAANTTSPTATADAPRAIRIARRQAASNTDLPGMMAASAVELALSRLEAGIQSSDEEKIKEALHAFWNEFDAASPREQIGMRRAIPTLVALWKGASSKLKEELLGTFHRFHFATEDMVDIYIEALSDPGLALYGTGAVSKAGPSGARATDAIIDQLKRNYHVSDAGPQDSAKARTSLEALANFGPGAMNSVPLLKEFMADTNLMYRVIGAKAYWKITGDAETVVPILAKAVVDDDSFWAAEILKDMGGSAASALPQLEKAYASGNSSTKVRAFQAIRSIDSSSAPDPQILLDVMNGDRRIDQISAMETLWNEYRNPDQVLPTLQRLVDDHRWQGIVNPDLITPLKILAEMGPLAESALPGIQKILEDPIGLSDVRIAATNAWLQIALGKPVPSVRRE